MCGVTKGQEASNHLEEREGGKETRGINRTNEWNVRYQKVEKRIKRKEKSNGRLTMRWDCESSGQGRERRKSEDEENGSR